MSNRLNQFLLLAAAVYGTGAIVVALSSHTAAPRPSTSITPAAPVAAPGEGAVLLPTVVVRPEPTLPTLSAVTVTASRSALLSADARDEEPLREAVEHGSGTYALNPQPGAAFDMPYYSFGKTLRRASQE